MKNNRKNDGFDSRFNDNSENFFEDEDDDEEESWKEKVIEKAEEVASDLEEEIQKKKTQTEKNLEAFNEHRRRKNENDREFQSFDTGLEESSRRDDFNDFSLGEESEEDWKEKIDLPTFFILSVEIMLLTYFILAVLGYVPFF